MNDRDPTISSTFIPTEFLYMYIVNFRKEFRVTVYILEQQFWVLTRKESLSKFYNK